MADHRERVPNFGEPLAILAEKTIHGFPTSRAQLPRGLIRGQRMFSRSAPKIPPAAAFRCCTIWCRSSAQPISSRGHEQCGRR
jgi:hypothetical protein